MIRRGGVEQGAEGWGRDVRWPVHSAMQKEGYLGGNKAWIPPRA